MRAETRGRDPFLDVVRAGAILLVVCQHWLVPVLTLSGDELTAGNAYAAPGWWVFTWAGQVMPLVFFAGGAANLISLRAHLARGRGARDWLAARVHRLALPLLPLLVVWLPLPNLLVTLGVPVQPVRLGGAVAAQLLWFLAVYLAAILLTPLMVRAHERFGPTALTALISAALLVDIVRFGPSGAGGTIGFANALFVWVAVHQIGFCYADGRLGRLTPRSGAVLAVVGFGVTALMVAFGPYPASMVGMPGAPASNAGPPTACLIALGCGQVGVLLALRPLLVRLMSRPRFAAVLGWVGARCMSMYLWHMSALVAVGGVAVLVFGYATPTPGSAAWFAVLPLWLGAACVVLLVLLKLFGRFEASVRGARPTRALPSMPQLALGATVLAVGVLGLAATGFAAPERIGPYPFINPGTALWTSVLLTGLLVTRYRLPLPQGGTLRTGPVSRLLARLSTRP